MRRVTLVTLGVTGVFSGTLQPCLAQVTSAPIPIDQRAVATLTIPGYADFLAADGSAVWATNMGRVEKLRDDRTRPVATVPIAEPCGAMTVAFGALWVANCRDSSLVRIDLKTTKVTATIRTGLADPTGELSLAAGAGSVWVLTDPKGVLSRIDPTTNRIIARIAVAPYSYAATFGFDAVWITNTGAHPSEDAGSVQRIDPETNTVTATISVGPIPRFLAAGEGGVWTLNQGDGSVTRIDPRTNGTISIPLGAPGGGGDIDAGNGRVWVRTSKILLVTIDPTTRRIAEVFGPPAGSGAVRVAGNHVWVTAHDIHKVWVLAGRP